jgi:hypothetical protein
VCQQLFLFPGWIDVKACFSHIQNNLESLPRLVKALNEQVFFIHIFEVQLHRG